MFLLPPEMWDLILRKLVNICAEDIEKYRLISNFFGELVLNNANICNKISMVYIFKKIFYWDKSKNEELYRGFLFQCFGHCCIGGHLDFVKWMNKKYKIISEEIGCGDSILEMVCRNGKFDVCKWLVEVSNLKDGDINYALKGAYKHGNLEMIKYLHARTHLSRKQVTTIKYYPFQQIAAENGHLEVLKWFHSVFKLTKQDIINGNGWLSALYIAAVGGHIDVIEWFCSTFNLMANDTICCEGFRGAFQGAAVGGQLETLKWLHQNCNLSNLELNNDCYSRAFCATIEGSLIKACGTSETQLEILNWLHSNFTINVEIVRERYNFIFKEAAIEGHVNVLKWLHSIFDLTEELKSKDNWALKIALERGHLNILQWLKDSFNITKV